MNLFDVWLAGFSFVVVILNKRIFVAIKYVDECYIDYSFDGLETINCSLLNPENIYTSVYAGLGKNPEVIYLASLLPEGNITVNLLGVPFRSYPELKRIISRRNILIQIKTHDDMYTRQDRQSFIEMFERLNKLEYLECSFSFYHEPIHFILPKNLKTYNISGNSYSYLDISGSLELDDLDANENSRLSNVPRFHEPVPPLTKLRLKRCPLTDMTIVDLAPLCNLELLELEFSPLNRLVNEPGYCNCTILKQWAEETKFIIQSLKCYEPLGEKPACPTQYLIDSRKIREKCPLLKRGKVTSVVITILQYIFFSILFLLLLATLILYIIRHYHLKEWWREHHLRTSAESSLKMEEEEEVISAPEAYPEY